MRKSKPIICIVLTVHCGRHNDDYEVPKGNSWVCAPHNDGHIASYSTFERGRRWRIRELAQFVLGYKNISLLCRAEEAARQGMP